MKPGYGLRTHDLCAKFAQSEDEDVALLCRIARKTVQVRLAQKAYFAEKSGLAKKACLERSRALERELDDLLNYRKEEVATTPSLF